MQKDCIIVMGSGVSPEGNLTQIGKSRVQKSVELYNKNIAKRILMTGKYSHNISYIPQKTEAKAMKEYAIILGVSESHIFTEEHSLDTVGNAYFTKQFLEKMNWKNILIVTSNFHLARTEYLFKKVYGKEFIIDIIPSLTFLSTDELLNKIDKEHNFIEQFKSQLEKIRDGDDVKVKELMKTLPWYKII